MLFCTSAQRQARAVPEMVYLQETAAESPFPSYLNARLEEAAEKRLFCALRFAPRLPAAARNWFSSSLFGTTEVVP